jgi:hypothetical protein
MATLTTITPGIHGWLPDEERSYNFYGADALVKYIARPSEDGGNYWQFVASVAGTTIKHDSEIYDADRITCRVQETCGEMVLAGLALGMVTLVAVAE